MERCYPPTHAQRLAEIMAFLTREKIRFSLQHSFAQLIEIWGAFLNSVHIKPSSHMHSSVFRAGEFISCHHWQWQSRGCSIRDIFFIVPILIFADFISTYLKCNTVTQGIDVGLWFTYLTYVVACSFFLSVHVSYFLLCRSNCYRGIEVVQQLVVLPHSKEVTSLNPGSDMVSLSV